MVLMLHGWTYDGHKAGVTIFLAAGLSLLPVGTMSSPWFARGQLEHQSFPIAQPSYCNYSFIHRNTNFVLGNYNTLRNYACDISAVLQTHCKVLQIYCNIIGLLGVIC